MWRGWLVLPILLPVLGGIGVLGIHTLRVRQAGGLPAAGGSAAAGGRGVPHGGGATCAPHP